MLKPEVGQSVRFVNSLGKEQGALVTAVWGDDKPAVNLIIVSLDENKKDTFGRQTEHHGSVVHEDNQSAHGMYWF